MKRKIEFASHPANLSMMRSFVRQFLDDCIFADIEKDLIVLGLDEASTNIIRHAYNHEETRLISLSCEVLKAGVRFRLRDYGVQSDLAKLEGRPLDVVQPGGLGMHLIRKAFDKVDYILKKEGTELVLVKSSGTKI